MLTDIEDAPLDMCGVGGGGIEKIFVHTKVEKSVLRLWGGKVLKKYVYQNKLANRSVQNRKGIRQNPIFPFFDET